MKWTIVVLVVLVLALAGATAYLGYDRIASDDDGGSEPEQPTASGPGGVTPTAGPSVDLALSRRCYEAWAEQQMMGSVMLAIMRDMPEGTDLAEWMNAGMSTAFGADWKDQMDSAVQLWQVTCLSPEVVPVPIPVSDTNVLCTAARAEALRMSGTPPDEMSGVDYKRLTVLETFARSHCP